MDISKIHVSYSFNLLVKVKHKYPSILWFSLINNYKTYQIVYKNNIIQDKQIMKEFYIFLKNSVVAIINNLLVDIVNKTLNLHDILFQ